MGQLCLLLLSVSEPVDLVPWNLQQHNATGCHHNLTPFNFLHLIKRTWQTCKLVRWEWHTILRLRVWTDVQKHVHIHNQTLLNMSRNIPCHQVSSRLAAQIRGILRTPPRWKMSAHLICLFTWQKARSLTFPCVGLAAEFLMQIRVQY